jgi:hypothetical protein
MNLIPLIVLLAFSGVCVAQQFSKYPFETGMIEYKLEGYSKGKQVTYWSKFGYNEYTIVEQETNLLGEKSVSKKATLVLGDFIYEWSLNDKYLRKTFNYDTEIWQQGKFTASDWESFFRKCMDIQGYEKAGNEKINNKMCEIYNGLQKRWYWNGLLMKTESALLNNKQVMLVSKMKTNIDIPPSFFDVPDGKIVIDNSQRKLEMQFDEGEEYNPSELKNNLDKLFKKE